MAVKRGEIQPPRRFYKRVEAASAEGGFTILLDGRAPRTPGGAALIVPEAGLAEMIAKEWSVQAEYIEFFDMPATRLANTAIDGVPAARAETQASIVAYAGSDLLCYLAEGPPGLVQRQRATWDPLIEWARERLGLEFRQTAGIIHSPQPEATLLAVAGLAARSDDFALAALAFAVPLFGSVILSLALADARLTGAGALEASRIEEAFQEERWGADAEAAARTAVLRRDASMLEQWFAVTRPVLVNLS